MDNVRPVPMVGSDDWFRWMWLASRGGNADADTLSILRVAVFTSDSTSAARLAALTALWSLAPVSVAIDVETRLLDDGEIALGLAGLAHPRWWKDDNWLTASLGWMGRSPALDSAVARVLSWTERPVSWVRIPLEVWERLGIRRVDTVSWIDVLETGLNRVEQTPTSAFETFWRQHIQDWARRWLQWEECLSLYRWRLREESDLVAWTQSEPYPGSMPDVPEVELARSVLDRPVAEALYFIVLGLGYTLGYDQSVSAAAYWDGVWSSWSSSLHYMTFETLANVQTTEWHIGGLTGALRHRYAVKRWGLRLD